MTYNSYMGQVFYDHMGNLVDEVGVSNNTKLAEQKIKAAAKTLNGRWAFGMIKLMVKETAQSAEEWSNAIVFPDGKIRPLKIGEKTETVQPNGAKYLTIDDVRKVYPRVKAAPAMRFPYTGEWISVRKHKFNSIVELEKHCRTFTNTLFVVDPQTMEKNDEDYGFVVHMVHAPR